MIKFPTLKYLNLNKLKKFEPLVVKNDYIVQGKPSKQLSIEGLILEQFDFNLETTPDFPPYIADAPSEQKAVRFFRK